MNYIKIIAECIGFLAVGVGFVIFQQKTKKHLLFAKLCADILWITHFLMIGATSGMAITIVGACRSITFLIMAIKGKEENRAVLPIFMVAGVFAVIISWKSIYSVCSLVSCILGTLGYWQRNPNKTKLLSFGVCISQIIYAICVGSSAAIINEIITVSSIVIFFTRYFLKRKSKDDQSALTQ